MVDLPTPPFPEATAMMASTPGIPAGEGAAGPPGEPPGRGRDVGPAVVGTGEGPPRACPAPAARSAVSATITDCTPGSAPTAFCARSRTASHSCTAPASTVIEKNTLPSATTMSESLPVAGNGTPAGLAILPSAPRTSSFAMLIPDHRKSDLYIGEPVRRSILLSGVDALASAGP